MKQMKRRAFVARAFATLAAVALGVAPTFGGEVLDAEKMKSALRATTTGQAAFIDDVAAKAADGILPRKILYASFNFAMKKPDDRRVYFFRLCLVQLTKNAGLKIDFLSF